MSTEPNKPDPKDLSMNLRMLIAFALTGLIIFGTPYFYKAIGYKLPEKTEQQSAPGSKPPSASTSEATPNRPAETPATPATTPASTPASTPAGGPTVAKPRAGASVTSETVAAPSEENVTLDTDLYHVVFSNRGAVVKNWTLKKYPDHAGMPLDVVNAAAAPKTGYPFQYDIRGAKPPADLNKTLFKATESPDGLNVTFEYSSDGVTARKTFDFKRASYLIEVTSSLSWNGQPLPHLLVWRGGFGDMAVPNVASAESEVYYDSTSNKIERVKVTAADHGAVNQDGSSYMQKHWYGETSSVRPSAATFSWVGLEDQYFAAIFLPSKGAKVQTTIYDDKVETPFSKSQESLLGLAVGGSADTRLSLYLGPKDPEILRSLNPELEAIVNFGFFAIIAKPLFISLHWIYGHVTNWGWCIIVATIIINLVLFPLRLANLKSMRKMQGLQPEIAKINEKYKALPLRDPRQADKNAEMMALYSKAGTNPMSGCIPMLVQMPFLFAFYKVLYVSIALRGASWLWVTDLSQPEQIAIRVLPIFLVITGFVMQKMTPMTTVDPSQQKTMMLMPLMMGFIFYQASSGLVLYWLTGNLVGIAQQWVLNKAMPKPDAPAPTKEVKKSNNRK